MTCIQACALLKYLYPNEEESPSICGSLLHNTLLIKTEYILNPIYRQSVGFI